MNIKDKQINYITLLLSLLLHAALFIQFSNTAMSSSQAQAPVLDTRISLNLLPPVKQKQQKVVEVKPFKPKKVAKKKLKKKKKMLQPAHEQAVAPKIKKEVQRQQIEDVVLVQQRYFSTLLTHIEGYKHYPRSARRRGIEGSILVSFRLLANGDITGLKASGGHLMLRRAAKSSVTDALPLPLCPPEITCPMQVSYAMQFKLR
ncbi:MAG: TonB family protein [Woeseiaceae bacterium]